MLFLVHLKVILDDVRLNEAFIYWGNSPGIRALPQKCLVCRDIQNKCYK